jgi:hypothetical protein
MFSIPKKNCYLKKKKHIFENFNISENKCIFSVEAAKVIGYICRTLLLTNWVTKMNQTNINSVEVHPPLSRKGAPSGW